MKSTMAKYLWEIPYNEQNEINKIPAQAVESYRKYVHELVSLGYVNKMAELYWEEKCFIHADCHWESIFVKDGKAKVHIYQLFWIGLLINSLRTPVIIVVVLFGSPGCI